MAVADPLHLDTCNLRQASIKDVRATWRSNTYKDRIANLELWRISVGFGVSI